MYIIRERALEALRKGLTHYTHSLGAYNLRCEIAEYYNEEYELRSKVKPEDVIVTSGTSPALPLIFGAILDRNDEVILSNPHYPCYPNMTKFIGGKPRFVFVREEEVFQLNPEKVKEAITRKTKAILINSPANPTGNLLSPEWMEEIASFGIPVISDEIYHGLVYKGEAKSILEFAEKGRELIALNEFSKLFAMTGWRLGYIIVPQDLIRPIQKMIQNFFISPNAFVQEAAIAALNECEEETEKMRRIYDERRKFMIKRLREIGFGITVEPTGAFYVFANAKRFANDSYKLAFEILEKAKVGVTPGVDFGSGGEGYIRFSYANSLDNIREGLARIERFLAN
jgi:aspartate/methionine/tyrosine aminotransferase